MDDSQKQEHKKHAVTCFNETWNLIDKTKRSQEEIDRMIHLAHASRFHWGEIGTPLEFARGEWQISRVYAVLNRHEPALYHGKRSLEICEENGVRDYDIAFGYEAIARAYAIAGNKDEALKYLALGKEAVENIKDDNDKEYTLSEIKAVEEML